MPPIVTTNATIMCVHGGQVMLVPKQTQVTIQGGSVLCEGDLSGAPIVGCALAPSPGTKPCTTVISTLPGSSAPTVSVLGRPVLLATLSGMTDAVPPGTIMVASPGQATVQA
ncbi:hypothetical protein FSW04_13435 [Baekduia soli]|uniref:DUF4280 domain-containing protein n=1 Tax=Baekduia soli TaxID=496014 RepID=A0A5B8U6A6_9ACTN|nr:hypothetical protein [Baekduia soli]QEC48471.1 hypothetical protein FSW04_13435 [Baekduia soli]